MIWQGAGLWMLEGEETADLHAHAHHAIQVTFGLKGWFEISVGDDKLSGPVSAVASDALHGFRASGAVAFLFLGTESTIGRALGSELFADRACVNVTDGPLATALEALSECFACGGDHDDLRQVGRLILDSLPASEPQAMPDPRVLAMIAYARHGLETRVSLTEAAAHAGLSSERARHLFVAHTGLPFKTYLLWLRIERATELYATGSSLTEAAHEAGFADSAHFSRTFRRTFGLPAAALRLYYD